MQFYPAELKARYGGYYRLGGWFVKLIGHPQLMRFATQHGMPHPVLMRFVHGRGRYWVDMSGTRSLEFAEG